ncbi:MAG: pantoate--beta-alanine ligase [Bacteriovoracaceae bacterium]|jgi:pantoate--beta-alanine ligase|nr:pantoate--beta-alanine ligase [Bacteriovoracaceae bacterium]
MLQVLENNKSLFSFLEDHKDIGFVPTMGNLHRGHLNLVKASLEQNDTTIVSIYVNPTQFAQGEDLEKYPRTLEQDISQITELLNTYPDKHIGIYTPSKKDIYPSDISIYNKVTKYEKELEGMLRPTHFSGVVGVVHRLFDLIKPSKAYFGKKDYQQIVVVKNMVNELNLGIKIVPIDIAREDNGLALSSRNGYLTDEQKSDALKLRHTLLSVKEILLSDGFDAIDYDSYSFLNYLSIRDANTFELANNKTEKIVILGNYTMNGVNLLDNVEVDIR